MPSSDEKGSRKLSRRSFLKVGGTLAAFGMVGIGIGGASILFPSRKADGATKDSSSSATTQTATSSATATLTKTPLPTLPPWFTETLISPPPTTSAQSVQSTAPFSIFWITDTQFLSEKNPAIYKNMTQWIVDNWGAENGKMVIHTGDLVETGSIDAEWAHADAAMSLLLKNGIPYSWCAGNHDDLVGSDPTSGWIGNLWDAFNPSVAGRKIDAMHNTSWVSEYHDAMNTAVGFSASGLNFLVINVEWNAEPDVLEWVRGILDDPVFLHHRIIVAPHAYIDAAGSVDDPRWGSELSAFLTKLTEIIDAHSSSVFLTLNGHFATDHGYYSPSPVKGRNQLMFDRQDSTDDPENPMAISTTDDAKRLGGGTITILTFDTEKNRISVKTYDTYTGKYRTDSTEQYAFDMFPKASNVTSASNSMAPVTTSSDRFIFPMPRFAASGP
ncbi:MAG: metallophosphoesterase [Thaumarchaeota archaeon]|nr:metallophosphoesterase [Nitrososphaerota archaeon]